MSETLFKLCGIALFSVMLITLLKKWGGDFSVLVKIAASVVLCGVCVGVLSPAITYIYELSSLSESVISLSVISTLVRALTVAFISHICASVCRDCGEPSIAYYVELCGKGEILLLSLPMIRDIIDTVQKILDMA